MRFANKSIAIWESCHYSLTRTTWIASWAMYLRFWFWYVLFISCHDSSPHWQRQMRHGTLICAIYTAAWLTSISIYVASWLVTLQQRQVRHDSDMLLSATWLSHVDSNMSVMCDMSVICDMYMSHMWYVHRHDWVMSHWCHIPDMYMATWLIDVRYQYLHLLIIQRHDSSLLRQRQVHRDSFISVISMASWRIFIYYFYGYMTHLFPDHGKGVITHFMNHSIRGTNESWNESSRLSRGRKRDESWSKWVMKWVYEAQMSHDIDYGVALVSRIDKIIGLFCKRAL